MFSHLTPEAPRDAMMQPKDETSDSQVEYLGPKGNEAQEPVAVDMVEPQVNASSVLAVIVSVARPNG